MTENRRKDFPKVNQLVHKQPWDSYGTINSVPMESSRANVCVAFRIIRGMLTRN